MGMMPFAGVSKYFGKKTDMPMYDEILENLKWGKAYWRRSKGKDINIVNMSPDEYMGHAHKIRNNPKHSLLDEYKRVDKGDVNKYAGDMQKGDKFPIPVLDHVGATQEGSHRAMAAKQLGEKSIPVVVVTPFKQ
jgi:hypothetical protein